MVAALYVAEDGVYASMADVDPWPAVRDARHYHGPWPVVAHPPCGPWGANRWHARPDWWDLGLYAIEQVRRYGGVLEQPRGSGLWQAGGLPTPGTGCDRHGGYSITLYQWWWGHRSSKPTWLYLSRVDDRLVARLVAERIAALTPVGRRVTVCIQNMSSDSPERSATPPAFARFLVDIAASVRP